MNKTDEIFLEKKTKFIFSYLLASDCKLNKVVRNILLVTTNGKIIDADAYRLYGLLIGNNLNSEVFSKV